MTKNNIRNLLVKQNNKTKKELSVEEYTKAKCRFSELENETS